MDFQKGKTKKWKIPGGHSKFENPGGQLQKIRYSQQRGGGTIFFLEKLIISLISFNVVGSLLFS